MCYSPTIVCRRKSGVYIGVFRSLVSENAYKIKKTLVVFK